MFIYKYLKILYRLLAAIFEYKFTEMFLMIHLLQKIPVAPMSMLDPCSAHNRHQWNFVCAHVFGRGGDQNYPKSYFFCDLKLHAKFQNP